MSFWPKLREGAIRAWHAVLDYDRKIPPDRRAANTEKRADAKERRMDKDAAKARAAEKLAEWRRDQQRAIADLERLEVVVPEIVRTNEVTHIPDNPEFVSGPVTRMSDGLQPLPSTTRFPALRRGQCPQCGELMKKTAKSTSAASGCIIVILGLALSFFLIGIPILLAGLYFMFKTEGFWLCRRCGYQGHREISSLPLLILLLIAGAAIWYLVTVARAA